MANALYPKWKEALLSGDANSALTSAGLSGVYAVLLNNQYIYNAAHQYYSSIPVPAFAAPELEIDNITVINGIVNGNDITFLSVLSGPLITSIVIYRRNLGANTTWRLVAYLDTNVSGLPGVPNGNDIIVNWGVTGIFGL